MGNDHLHLDNWTVFLLVGSPNETTQDDRTDGNTICQGDRQDVGTLFIIILVMF